jgi:D-lactate dehydrogenase
MSDIEVPYEFTGPGFTHERNEAVSIMSVFVHDRINREILDLYPNVKLIAARSTGFDNIDLETCKERGISVCNVPRYGDNTVAEHTFALILSLSRNLRKAYLKALADDYTTKDLMGFDLKGKTLGVVGTGKIGLRVIKIAKGFSMDVIASDVYRDEFNADVLGFRYASFDELLGSSDIISLHAPLTADTRHMINGETLKKVKRGVILINTSRGGLVHTAALVQALDDGTVSGAGLDVLEYEEFIDTQEDDMLNGDSDPSMEKQMIHQYNLLRRPNVVFTPHVAFNSREAIERILETTAGNIKAYIQGEIRNMVNS